MSDITTQAVEQLREDIKSELLSLAYSSAKKGPDWSQDGVGLPALDTLETIISAIVDTLKIVGGDVISCNEDDPDRNPRWQAYRNQLRDEQRQRLELVVEEMLGR